MQGKTWNYQQLPTALFKGYIHLAILLIESFGLT